MAKEMALPSSHFSALHSRYARAGGEGERGEECGKNIAGREGREREAGRGNGVAVGLSCRLRDVGEGGMCVEGQGGRKGEGKGQEC